MSDLHEQLLAAFQVEHREYLAGIRAHLAKMEKEGNASTADLDEAFRLAHSLKGAARVCDFPTVAAVGQRLETFFARLRKGQTPPGRDVIAAVHLVLNALEEWSIGLAENRNPPEPANAIEMMDRMLGGDSFNSLRPDERQKEKAASPVDEDDLGSKLLAAFQIEHKEHLEGIRVILAAVEQDGTVSRAALDEAFRRAHSLKGAARIADLRAAEALAHRLETLFSQVRDDNLQLDADVLRAIHLGLDAIEDWAAAMFGKRSPPNPAAALDAIEAVISGPKPAKEKTNDESTNRETLPAAAPVPRPSLPAPLVSSFHTAPDAAARAAPLAAVESVRVSAENLDRLLRSAGLFLSENLRQNLVGRELSGLDRQIEGMAREWETVRKTAAGALRQLTATPALAPLARYIQQVADEIRSLSRRARAARLQQQRSSFSLQLLGGQLQKDVRRVRTVPAESIFQGLRKMVRDLARDEGKEVELRVTGFEIEADRMVLQALKDPLMHILCNAVSHGLEPPEERRGLGKNPAGRVTLNLQAVGNRLQILVQDDGRGLDRRKVAEMAVRRGFLSEAEAAAIASEELDRLIFRPGFSTLRLVTGVSGRGMGLSVVAETVARLQGEVELRSTEGPGTAFFLSVPLSIATQRLLLVSCRDQTFAVPVHGIQQLLRKKIQDVENVEGRPMLLLGGQPIPLLSLAQLLGMGEGGVQAEGNVLSVLILRSGTKRVAAIVDRFLAERDSLVKKLDDPARQVSKLAGGILLEDGSVALVVNPTELITALKPTDKLPDLNLGALTQLRSPLAEKRIPTVLVVDDSLTTRTLEKSILEAHGYKVRLAVDGIEALAQLRSEPADLVLTDIQMPRLDGFGLLEEIKKDPRLAQLPVVVVTSMERREDQERGLALGADAYIVKRKFDHQELLDTIRQIL